MDNVWDSLFSFWLESYWFYTLIIGVKELFWTYNSCHVLVVLFSSAVADIYCIIKQLFLAYYMCYHRVCTRWWLAVRSWIVPCSRYTTWPRRSVTSNAHWTLLRRFASNPHVWVENTSQLQRSIIKHILNEAVCKSLHPSAGTTHTAVKIRCTTGVLEPLLLGMLDDWRS